MHRAAAVGAVQGGGYLSCCWQAAGLGDSQSGPNQQILRCPSFPAWLSLLLGASGSPAARQALRQPTCWRSAPFAPTKGERPRFTPCLLGLRHVFRQLLRAIVLRGRFTLCGVFVSPKLGETLPVCCSFLLLLCSVAAQVWSC